MIQFIKEHIIHKFGIPQSITTDQGTMFTREEMNYFAYPTVYYGYMVRYIVGFLGKL